MLDSLTFTGRELLIAIVLATVVYLFEVLLFSRRRDAGGRVARARVEALEAELAAVRARLDALEARAPAGGVEEPAESTHAEAARMARAGAGADELVALLGISRSEAELIVALYGSGG